MILFLSVFPPYRGGISRFSDFVYRNIESNADIEALNFEVLYPKLLFPGSSQFDDKQEVKYQNYLMHSYNPLKWRKTARYIVQRRPQILLLSHWHPFFIPGYNSVIKYVRKKLPAIKITTIAHNVVPHEGFPFSNSLMRSFFKKNDVVITLSNQTTQELNGLNLANTSNLKLFHPIYEADTPKESEQQLRKKYGFEEDDFILLFFGLVREYKGLDVLISALNKMDLQKKKIKPLIVGEFYDSKQKYIDLIEPGQLDKYTIIDRFVSTAESTEIFTISNLLALPYKTASQSGVLADALNFELPALVSNQPGVTEYLEDEKNCLIFESENTEELIEKLNKYLSNKALQVELNQNIKDLKLKLSWNSFSSSLFNYLNNL